MDFEYFIGLTFYVYLACFVYNLVFRGLLSLFSYSKDLDDALKINFKNE